MANYSITKDEASDVVVSFSKNSTDKVILTKDDGNTRVSVSKNAANKVSPVKAGGSVLPIIYDDFTDTANVELENHSITPFYPVGVSTWTRPTGMNTSMKVNGSNELVQALGS